MNADDFVGPPAVGGDMRQRVRSFDWSTTPVGPMSAWEPTLRTTASLVLASALPTCLLWGETLTIVAYNDAYRPHMEDMPEALGRPYLEYWAPSREVLMRDTARAWAGETVSVRAARFTVFRNGGPVDAWYDYAFSPVVDETGRVVGVLNTGIDITAQMRAEAQLRDSEARWRGLFERMGESLQVDEIVYGPDGRAADLRYIDVNPAWERQIGLSRETVRGRLASEFFPAKDLAFWLDVFERVDRTGETEHVTQYFEPVNRWFETITYRLEPRTVAVLALDVTDRHRAAERQELLMREVDHRAKNALAVMLAALRLTRAPDLPSYKQALEGRVSALARAQTLLADDCWAGADLLTLLRGELGSFFDRGSEQVELQGPTVMLPPGTAQPLAMAIHELATNAIKYGALSNPSGRAKIFWCVDDAPETALRLTWTEEGGPPIEGAPARDGFGTRLLMGTITQQLGGKVSKTWPSSGLVCTIEVPLRSPSLTAQTTMAAALGG